MAINQNAKQKQQASAGSRPLAISVRTPFIRDLQIGERVYAVGVANAANVQNEILRALAANTGGFMLVTGEIPQDDEFLLEKFFIQVLAGVGDTVRWVWDSSDHSTTSDTGIWDSGVRNVGAPPFDHVFMAAGTFPYHCTQHGAPGFGMRGSITVNL